MDTRTEIEILKENTMAELTEKQKLIIKCLDFYVSTLTDGNTKCPTIEQMREIVKIDEIKTSIAAPKEAK